MRKITIAAVVVVLLASLFAAGQAVASPEPTQEGILGRHTIRGGEHLYSIARAYGVDPAAIARASGLFSVNQVLQPGWVLTIPNAPMTHVAGPTAVAQFGALASATVPPVQQSVIVPQGDVKVLSGAQTQIRYSHYWPPLGGVNTSRPDAPHLARCANGARWQDHVGVGCACPPEWPFGTVVILDGQRWTCVDRGGMIKFVNGIPWVDFLVPNAAYGYGTVVEVEVIFP